MTCRPQYFKDWGALGFFPNPTAYSQDLLFSRATALDPNLDEDIRAIPVPEWTWQTERLAEAIIPLQRKVKKTYT